jgi:hypothetical protein
MPTTHVPDELSSSIVQNLIPYIPADCLCHTEAKIPHVTPHIYLPELITNTNTSLAGMSERGNAIVPCDADHEGVVFSPHITAANSQNRFAGYS